MIVKVAKNGVVGGITECSHIEMTPFPSLGSPGRNARDLETGRAPFRADEIGVLVECCGVKGGGPNVTYRIPAQGDSIYVSNEGGKTVQSYHVDDEGNSIRPTVFHAAQAKRGEVEIDNTVTASRS